MSLNDNETSQPREKKSRGDGNSARERLLSDPNPAFWIWMQTILRDLRRGCSRNSVFDYVLQTFVKIELLTIAASLWHKDRRQATNLIILVRELNNANQYQTKRGTHWYQTSILSVHSATYVFRNLINRHLMPKRFPESPKDVIKKIIEDNLAT